MPATPVTVRPVASGRDHRRFINFGYSLYDGDQYFVPPLRMDQAKVLNPKKNPFFEHGEIGLFLAKDAGGKVVGRIAAIRNGMHLKKYDDDVGFFGFFETVDDETVADALLDAAAGWPRERGLTALRGPANPSLNHTSAPPVGGSSPDPSTLLASN